MKTSIMMAFTSVFIFNATSSMADPVKRSMGACISEDILNEYIGYVGKGDKKGRLQLLLSGQCVMLEVGEDVSVISPGFMIATIRYRGVKLFTPTEAISR